MRIREVKRIVKGYKTQDGAGVHLIRVLGHDDVQDIDPFLMLDAFGSEDPKDYIKGFPMHPHRGIETITYLLEGRVDHRDSLGNGGTILGGQLQWMTAGKGILHEEMPKETKKLDGLQFWLNLPQKDKMVSPGYFPITKDMVKNIDIGVGRIQLIAGEYLGEKAVETKYVKVTMMDVMLKPDSEYDIPVAKDQNAFLYIIEGSASFGEKRIQSEKQSAVLFGEGDTIRIHTSDLGIQFVLLAGKPLGEPIAWGGPVVMNTPFEVETAFRQLERGTFL